MSRNEGTPLRARTAALAMAALFALGARALCFSPDVDGTRVAELAARLSGREFGGREIGTAGSAGAAALLASLLEDAGFDVRFQEFRETAPFNVRKAAFEIAYPDGSVKTLAYHEDFREMIRGGYDGGEARGPLVLARHPGESFPKGAVLLVPAGDYNPDDDSLYARAGAAGLITESKMIDARPMYSGQQPNEIVAPRKGFVKIAASAAVFGQLEEAARAKATVRIVNPVDFREVKGRNIIASYNGDGGKFEPRLALAAHYDHLGTETDGSFFPGALDNASGTSLAVAIAQTLAAAAIRGDFAIVLSDGEEVNLSGASAFVRDPSFDFAGIPVLNFDMVGSAADLPLDIEYFTAASEDFAMEMKEVLEKAGFRAEPKFRQASSDHTVYSSMGALSVSIVEFDESRYHTKRDTPEFLSAGELDRLGDAFAAWALERILSQNAGTTPPPYVLRMKSFTFLLVRAAASSAIAGFFESPFLTTRIFA